MYVSQNLSSNSCICMNIMFQQRTNARTMDSHAHTKKNSLLDASGKHVMVNAVTI